MNKKFFMIYVEGKDSPTFKHESYDSAIYEAERLARKTKKQVYILQAIQKVEICDLKITQLV